MSSNGNSSLGREEHVRQVSPDRHQATVRNRFQLKIGTWNVQTMMQKGKIENVKQKMKRMKVNILGLSEMRWKGVGCITSDGYKILHSGGEHHYRGVDVIFKAETSKATKVFWTVSDRGIIFKLQGKPLDIGLVQIYAPSADKDGDEVEIFYGTTIGLYGLFGFLTSSSTTRPAISRTGPSTDF